jgi:hypothetical protein
VRWWSNAVNCSCFRSRAVWHTPANPCDTPVPRCVGYVWEELAFSLVHALPSPLSADGVPSLFKGFLGTLTWSDASETGMAAVRPDAFASRSVPCWLSDISEVSRFSCRKYLDVPRVSDDAGSAGDSRSRPQLYGLPPKSSGVGTPITAFRRSIAQPADAPIDASMGPSRHPPQDLGSGWLAIPFL